MGLVIGGAGERGGLRQSVGDFSDVEIYYQSAQEAITKMAESILS